MPDQIEYENGILIEGSPHELSQHISAIAAKGGQFKFVGGKVIEVYGLPGEKKEPPALVSGISDTAEEKVEKAPEPVVEAVVEVEKTPEPASEREVKPARGRSRRATEENS